MCCVYLQGEDQVRGSLVRGLTNEREPCGGVKLRGRILFVR